jgi:RNA ligase (TIGR02306 family)
MNEKLVYIGKIISLEPIEGADFIVSATVICGQGGKWKGVVKKSDFKIDDKCIVYLPDSLLPHSEEFHFMEARGWRVRMCRFKGAPSEVLIMPDELYYSGGFDIGRDITQEKGVTKYFKPIPSNLACDTKGQFPSFIPKTDEPNYQNQEGQEGVQKLIGHSYYITEKADGSSTTAYKYKGEFGVCSRNWELKYNADNGYWKIADRYNLKETLPEGYAIQWETVGPKIQGNPMEWKEIQGLMFSAYNIEERRYCTSVELCKLSLRLNFPMVMILKDGYSFSSEGLELLGQGNYDNGKPREGVVVRSTENLLGHKPISFKVINLDYEK